MEATLVSGFRIGAECVVFQVKLQIGKQLGLIFCDIARIIDRAILAFWQEAVRWRH